MFKFMMPPQNMIFTRRFFILFALGVLPLIFAWGAPAIKWGFDRLRPDPAAHRLC